MQTQLPPPNFHERMSPCGTSRTWSFVPCGGNATEDVPLAVPTQNSTYAVPKFCMKGEADSSTQSLLKATMPLVEGWLRDNFELETSGIISKEDMYKVYCKFCDQSDLKALTPAVFGKVVRGVFGPLPIKRLGSKRSSKYYTAGLRRKVQKPDGTVSPSSLTAGAFAEGVQVKFEENPRKRRKKTALNPTEGGESESDNTTITTTTTTMTTTTSSASCLTTTTTTTAGAALSFPAPLSHFPRRASSFSEVGPRRNSGRASLSSTTLPLSPLTATDSSPFLGEFADLLDSTANGNSSSSSSSSSSGYCSAAWTSALYNQRGMSAVFDLPSFSVSAPVPAPCAPMAPPPLSTECLQMLDVYRQLSDTVVKWVRAGGYERAVAIASEFWTTLNSSVLSSDIFSNPLVVQQLLEIDEASLKALRDLLLSVLDNDNSASEASCPTADVRRFADDYFAVQRDIASRGFSAEVAGKRLELVNRCFYGEIVREASTTMLSLRARQAAARHSAASGTLLSLLLQASRPGVEQNVLSEITGKFAELFAGEASGARWRAWLQEFVQTAMIFAPWRNQPSSEATVGSVMLSWHTAVSTLARELYLAMFSHASAQQTRRGPAADEDMLVCRVTTIFHLTSSWVSQGLLGMLSKEPVPAAQPAPQPQSQSQPIFMLPALSSGPRFSKVLAQEFLPPTTPLSFDTQGWL